MYWFITTQIIILQFCRLEISQESHWAETKMVAGLLCSSLETAVKSTFPCIFQLLDTEVVPEEAQSQKDAQKVSTPSGTIYVLNAFL